MSSQYVPIIGGYAGEILEGTVVPVARTTDIESEIPNDYNWSTDNPRKHCRPLYMPCDKQNVWEPAELALLERMAFRPFAAAFHEPRFIYDFHNAGGILGSLRLAIVGHISTSKWLHEWENIRISYVDGCLEYVLDDRDFPMVTVKLAICSLGEASGTILRIAVVGMVADMRLIWMFGGAVSDLMDHQYKYNKEMALTPEHAEHDRIEIKGISAFTLLRDFREDDPSMKFEMMAANLLPAWSAKVTGGGTSIRRIGFADANALASPLDFWRSAEWSEQGEMRQGRMAICETVDG